MKYVGDTYERSKSGLIVPDRLKSAAEHGDDIATCPAARLVNKDGEPAVRCGVAGDTFMIRQSPAAAGMWCCGEPGAHADPVQGCPVWAARDSDRAEKMQQAAQQRATDRITARQIASGARVDDREDGVMEAAATEMAAKFSAILADPYGEG